MGKRKVCVIVTARPSYSRVKTVLQAVKNHFDLDLQLVVAASALLNRYGDALLQIEMDGFKIDRKVLMVIEGENLVAMVKTTGLGLIELSTVLSDLSPDVVVTIADRYETIANALAASYMNIPLAHIQGGEVTGSIDEKVRHAVTKLSDIHFVASQKAYDRVVRMGENSEMVFNTGCPSIDIASSIDYGTKLDFDVYERYQGVGAWFDYSQRYVVVMQHPVSTEYESVRKQTYETLEAIHELDLPAFWFWPNVDAGSDGTSNAIRSFREFQNPPHMHFLKNLSPSDFLKLLYHAKCLVGNSSVGIRECSHLGVPVVNIGTRQNGRERGKNVIDSDYDRNDILAKTRKQIAHGRYSPDFIYGDGSAGQKIADLLSRIPLSIHKQLAY